MFCPQCGKEFPELAKFCPRCGYSVFEDIIDDKKASSEYSEKSGTGTFFGVTSQNTQTRVRAFQTGKYIRILLVAIVLVAGIFMLLQRVQQGRDSGSHEIAVGESVTFRSVDLSMQYAGAGVADINFNTQEALLFWGVYIDTSAEIQGVWIDNCEVDQANIGSYSSYSIEKIVDWNDYSAYPERVAEVTSTSFKNRLPLDSGKSDGYVISMAVPLDSLDIRLTLSVTDNIKVILVHPGNISDVYEDFVDTVDWREEGSTNRDFISGQIYRITGEVLYSGEYLIDDTYQIALRTPSSPLMNSYAYFSASEWKQVPTISSGDVITFYGTYEFWAAGWNFEDCTMTFPL